MNVGLTYDLRDDYLAEGYTLEETAEFDRADTLEGIEGALHTLGCETERVGNVRKLTAALAAGRRWDLVFNIAEGLRGLGRESQVPCLLEAWDIPYTFSDPFVLALCLHKGLTKRVVRANGVPTADWAEVNSEADIAAVRLPYPLFAKPVAEGTGKGITPASRLEGRDALEATCRRLLREHEQPVLVETFLPGREFTVGVAGTGPDARVIGVMEVRYRDRAGGIYSYHTKSHYEDLVDYHLVEGDAAAACARSALDAWRALGCRDGGRLDFRQDVHGLPNFIEANPLAGLNPAHSDLPILCRLLGVGFERLIGWFMASAEGRLRGARPPGFPGDDPWFAGRPGNPPAARG